MLYINYEYLQSICPEVLFNEIAYFLRCKSLKRIMYSNVIIVILANDIQIPFLIISLIYTLEIRINVEKYFWTSTVFHSSLEHLSDLQKHKEIKVLLFKKPTNSDKNLYILSIDFQWHYVIRLQHWTSLTILYMYSECPNSKQPKSERKEVLI